MIYQANIKARLLSFVLCVALLVSLLPAAVFVEAGNTDETSINTATTLSATSEDGSYAIDIRMDKTVAKPGDTVTFTFINKCNNDCNGIRFDLWDDSDDLCDLCDYFEDMEPTCESDVFGADDIEDYYTAEDIYTKVYASGKKVSGMDAEILSLTYTLKEGCETPQTLMFFTETPYEGITELGYCNEESKHGHLLQLDGKFTLTITDDISNVGSFAPTFTEPSGTVELGTSVEIFSEVDGAKIYYTIDGTEPTANSTMYTGAITLTDDKTIKAIAIKDNVRSDVVSAEYTVNLPESDLEVRAAAGYGGEVVRDVSDPNKYTFTAISDGTYNYVIDQIFVDGELLDGNIQGLDSYVWKPESLGDNATGVHSVVATFAYTLKVNFNDPDNGNMLSVVRVGDSKLKSGDIVRGGDVLEITSNLGVGLTLDDEKWQGLTRYPGKDNTYIVSAENGDPTPSITDDITTTAIPVPVPEAEGPFTYDGKTHTGVTIPEADKDSIEIVKEQGFCNEATNAGTYTTMLQLTDSEKYCWDYEGWPTENKTVEWTIEKASVSVPVAETGLFYTEGKTLVGVADTSETTPSGEPLYTLENNTAAEAGDYIAIATLTDPDNYQWADGADSDDDGKVEIAWSIIKQYKLTEGTAEHGVISGFAQLDEDRGLMKNVTSAVNGEKVQVATTPDTGYRLSELILAWKDEEGNQQEKTISIWEGVNTSNINSKFYYDITMPAGDVTVTPVFVLKTYGVTLRTSDPYNYGYQEYRAKIYKNEEETSYDVAPVPQDKVDVSDLTVAYGDTLTFVITAMDDTAAPVQSMVGAVYNEEKSTEDEWIFETKIGNDNSENVSYSIEIERAYPVHFPATITGGTVKRYRSDQLVDNIEAELSGYMQLRLKPADGYYLKSLRYHTGNEPGDGWDTDGWKEWEEKSKFYSDTYLWAMREETWIYPEFESTKDLAERYGCFGYDAKDKSVLISDEEGLFQLAKLVNEEGYDFYGATFKLAPEDGDTIQLTEDWTPIAGGISGQSCQFSGNFDGAGCTVSGMCITDETVQCRYYGLFGCATEATIENLAVEGSIDLEYATGDVGGIAGCAKELRNCTGNVEIRLNHRARSVGGLVGTLGRYNTNSGTKYEFYDHYQNGVLYGCVNQGNITLNELGWREKPAGSAGTSASSYGSYQYVGGIVGLIVGDTVEQCGNYGDISITENYQKQSSQNSSGAMHDHVGAAVGGIIGEAMLTESTDGFIGSESISVKNCFNHGDILEHFADGGGIVGMSRCTETKIENCYNTGRIEQTARGQEEPCPTIRLGGIVGCTHRGMPDYVTDIVNCYSTTLPTCEHVYTWMGISAICADDTPDALNCEGTTTIINCFGHDELGEANMNRLLAVRNGAGEAVYVKVSGFAYPVLWWEQSDFEDSTETYSLTFAVTGEKNTAYTVELYHDAAGSDLVGKFTGQTGTDTVYTGLTAGTYYYIVTSSGYVTEKGIVTLLRDQTVSLALQQSCSVQFRVSPADAELKLMLNGSTVSPSGKQSYGSYAVYNYENLLAGSTYTYTVTKKGYYSYVSNIQMEQGNNGPFTVELEEAPLEITAAIDPQYDGDGYLKAQADGYHISEGGVYNIVPGTYGSKYQIHIDTIKPVTLLGNGAADGSEACREIYITCRAGVDLSLRDVYFYNKTKSGAQNMIDFTGSGNILSFASVNVLDQDTTDAGCALIHVGPDTALTITGGMAYMYKSELGTAIGGNGGGSGLTAELWGRITIKDATMFIKGNKTGALIGSGADVGKNKTSQNEIRIENSTLNLIATARGAAIGGGAGSSGGGAGGDNVTIKDSTVNIDVEWTGAAIGGAGGNDYNDASGGSLYPERSSIRVYLLDNAVNFWKHKTYYYEPAVGGITTVPITAQVTANAGDAKPLVMDVSGLSGEKYFEFTVYGCPASGSMEQVYTGSTKQYRYRAESGGTGGGSTMSNWIEEADSELYLYLPTNKYKAYSSYKAQSGCWLYTLKKGSNGTYTVDTSSKEELHTYGDASYKWTEKEDGYTCTAELMCRVCGERITETVEAVGEVTKKATTEEEGLMTYTATFEDERFQMQTKTVSIPKLTEEEAEEEEDGDGEDNQDGEDDQDNQGGQDGEDNQDGSNHPSTDPDDSSADPDKTNPDDSSQSQGESSGTKLKDTETKNTYVVVKDGSTVMFTGTKKKNKTSLVIPNKVEIEGVTYKVIGVDARACKGNETIRKVTMKSNIITIGTAAFRGCTALKTVKIGNSVTTVGNKAFYDCKKMTSLTIGSSVTTIGNGAFRNCTSVAKVTIPVNVKKIGKNAFNNCKKAATLTVKTSNLTVKKIGNNAFYKTGSSNYKKLKVKVPKAKYTAYKKAFRKKGLSTKAKVVKN